MKSFSSPLTRWNAFERRKKKKEEKCIVVHGSFAPRSGDISCNTKV